MGWLLLCVALLDLEFDSFACFVDLLIILLIGIVLSLFWFDLLFEIWLVGFVLIWFVVGWLVWVNVVVCLFMFICWLLF